MKKIIGNILSLLIIILVVVYSKSIVFYITAAPYLYLNTNVKPNKYAKRESYKYAQITNDFIAKNQMDLTNIFYTVLDSGMKEFTFLCHYEYKECSSNIRDLISDSNKISDLNGLIHAYNTYKTMQTEQNGLGLVTIRIKYNYTNEEIEKINAKIDDLIIKLNINEKNVYKVAHDYIINNTKYDKVSSDNNVIPRYSDTAYGPLFNGLALCGGYTDAYYLFLDKFDVKQVRIQSDTHVWNGVIKDGKPLHVDLTWDDPYVPEGPGILRYDYYFITSNELYNLKTGQHFYDKSIFKEFS